MKTKKDVERFFVYLTPKFEKKYTEEVNMAMDCFLEESFDTGELTRFLYYLLEKVDDASYEEVSQKIETFLQ